MLTKELLQELRDYVDENRYIHSFLCMEQPDPYDDDLYDDLYKNEIVDFVEQTRKPKFNQVLFKFIDGKNAKDPVIYSKVGIDRRHFAKMRKPSYHPGKKTVISLSFALKLNKVETDRLLSAAGYALSESETFDLVIQFCLEKKIYDIHDVNMALDYFSLKPLAGEV